MKWLFMICVHVSEHQNMLFLTENTYIYIMIFVQFFIYTQKRDGSLYAYIYKLSYINNTTWSNLDVSVFHSPNHQVVAYFQPRTSMLHCCNLDTRHPVFLKKLVPRSLPRYTYLILCIYRSLGQILEISILTLGNLDV